MCPRLMVLPLLCRSNSKSSERTESPTVFNMSSHPTGQMFRNAYTTAFSLPWITLFDYYPHGFRYLDYLYSGHSASPVLVVSNELAHISMFCTDLITSCCQGRVVSASRVHREILEPYLTGTMSTSRGTSEGLRLTLCFNSHFNSHFD